MGKSFIQKMLGMKMFLNRATWGVLSFNRVAGLLTKLMASLETVKQLYMADGSHNVFGRGINYN